MIGQTIAHYKILEKLGGGGMGVVYKAEDLQLKRQVALKFLPLELTADPDAKGRFIHEAQAASSLEHSNICTIHEINETPDGQLFICMAYYEGKTLKKHIESGPLTFERIIDISMQICKGLQKAHEKGIIHRDIKPANIMITTDDEVRIVDFGLAKLSGQTVLTREGTTLGTVAYMSPEQARGDQVDHRTDIWSLGIVMYEMVCGRTPFRGEYDQAVLYEIASEKQRSLTGVRTGVPVELEYLINKCLAKKPEERYQHVDELLADFRRLKKESEPSRLISEVSQIEHVPLIRRFRWPIGFAAAVILLAIVTFVARSLFFNSAIAIQPNPIVVITFKNQTGEPAYDYLEQAIPNLLITSLEQSKYLRVITWERIYDLLKKLGKPDVKEIDRELGFEICRLEGVESIVLGSFIKAGDIFATDVKVLDVQSKVLLKSASAKGEGVGSILQRQIDELSEQISQVIIPTAEAGRASSLSVSDITTSSIEAYHYFLKGRDAFHKLYYPDAKHFIEKAIAFDSTFAIAYLYLARAQGALSEDEESDNSYEKAKMYAGRAGKKDQMYIDAWYANRIENNPEKRIRILEEIIHQYPQEKEAYTYLGWYYESRKQIDLAIATYEKVLEMDPQYGPVLNLMAYTYCDMKQFEKAAEYFDRYLKALPGDANPYDSIGELYLSMGQFDNAIDYYKQAIEVKPDFNTEWRIACIYALTGDYDQAIKWMDRMLKDQPVITYQVRGYRWKALFLYLTGRKQEAFQNLSESDRAADDMQSTSVKIPNYWLRTWFYLDQGDTRGSLTEYEKFYTYRRLTSPQYLADHKADYYYFRAIHLVSQAKSDSAKQFLKEIKRIMPELTPLGRERLNYFYDYLYTQILVADDSLYKAYDVYSQTRHYERPFRFTFNNYLKIFPLRKDALAQLAAKKGRSEIAISIYEEMTKLDNIKVIWGFPNPVYHYSLGKIYEEIGDVENAVDQYKIFLKLWRNADPDLEPLIDAKKRLASLTTS